MNKNKWNWLFLILGTTIILTLGIGRIVQIENNYKANQKIIEPCIDNGGTVVLDQRILRLSSVTCESNNN
ncbi:hypothetical protein N0O92_13130 [Alkalihalobacillus sp. MEB130]|uniref:hypothetical protein n=1 Tax=Alkalihalobacillus sp. MEB130 TaxID=2976704 RepID=UPI0028DDE1F8|nr:hypothetical protein [Alkalihalobacillus sp. MEB130]MDT8861178.1 hypothetical protein [Alkalihalobacillus sp. MEB130]